LVITFLFPVSSPDITNLDGKKLPNTLTCDKLIPQMTVLIKIDHAPVSFQVLNKWVSFFKLDVFCL